MFHNFTDYEKPFTFEDLNYHLGFSIWDLATNSYEEIDPRYISVRTIEVNVPGPLEMLVTDVPMGDCVASLGQS
jgi:hypothetical protein